MTDVTSALSSPLERTLVRWSTPRRIRMYATLMLAFALGGGLVNAFSGPGLLDRSGNAVGADFVAFYTGASFFLEGRLAEAYDLEAQRSFQRTLLGTPEAASIYPFIGPPHSVLLYVPFAAPGYRIGLALWWLCGLALLACAVALLRSELDVLGSRSLACLFGASFLFFPTVAWLLYGQATAVIGLLYVATFVALRRGLDTLAGLCLGSLAFKPQLALVLALVLIAKGRWRAVAGGAVAASGWLAVGFALSPEASVRYLELAPRLNDLLRHGVSGYFTWGIHSVYGFSILLFDAASPRAATVFAAVVSLGLVAWLLRAWRSMPWAPASRSWDLAMAASFAFGIAISPHLFVYDLALLLLPFAIVWQHHPGLRHGRPLDAGPLLAGSSLLWLVAFLGSQASSAQLDLTREIGGGFALQLSTVVLVGWALAILAASRRAEAPAS